MSDPLVRARRESGIAIKGQPGSLAASTLLRIAELEEVLGRLYRLNAEGVFTLPDEHYSAITDAAVVLERRWRELGVDWGGAVTSNVWRERVDILEEENRQLKDVLERMVVACEEDMAGPTTDCFGDDESVSSGIDGESVLTFGHIRGARAALAGAGAGRQGK